MALLIDSGSRTTGPTMEMKVKVAGVELSVEKTGQIIRLLEHYRHMAHFMEKLVTDEEVVRTKLEAAAPHFKTDLETCDTRWRSLMSTSSVLQMFQGEVAKYYTSYLHTAYVDFNLDGFLVRSSRPTAAEDCVGTSIVSDDTSICNYDDACDMSTDEGTLSTSRKRPIDQQTTLSAKRMSRTRPCQVRPLPPRSDGSNEPIDPEGATYPCPIQPCTSVVFTQNNLKNHLRKVHPAVLTTCSICNKKFDIRQTLLRHIQGVHRNLSDKEKMALYLIPADFERYNLPPKEKYVRQNPKKPTAVMPTDEIPLFDYRCQISGCKFKTYKLEELSKHEQTSHESMFACQMSGCYRNFEDPSSLDAHVLEVHSTDGQGFSCAIKECAAHFDYVAALKKHLKKQHPIEYTTCNRCEQTFSCRDNLVKHVRHMHKELNEAQQQEVLLLPADGGEERTETVPRCALEGCDLTFPNKDELDKHLQDNHPDVYVTCRFCHKVSTTVQHLKYHIMYMHEEGEYYCPEEGCNFMARFRKELKTHRFRLHKPTIKCKVAGCGETMFENNHTRHMLEVHQVKKFQCTWPDCEMIFMKQFHLKRHLRVHMNFKRFMCKWPECKYASEQKATVMTHVRVCHLKLPRTQREQKEKNISSDPNTQNPYDWIEALPEDVIC